MMTAASIPGARHRAEHDLILACARPGADVGRYVRDAAARVTDWSYVVAAARAHRVLPLLHRGLDAAGYDGVPTGVAAALRDEVRELSWRSVFITGQLLNILELLAASGIDAIPFKGPVVACTAYGSSTLRQFGDLDILVRPRDHVRARGLLVLHAFEPAAEWTPADRFNHEHTLMSHGRRVGVDVHSEVFARSVFPVDADGLWERAVQVEVGGRAVRTFSPEDTLLVLCVHADTHLWSRLQWICDIAWLLDAHPALDWGAVLRRARRSGSERILLLGLRVAADLVGARIPEDVARRAQEDATAGALAAEVTARLFRAPSRDAASLDLEKSIFQLRSRPRLRDKIRLAAAPNETDWALLPLPARLYALYYVMRPFRLLAKYGLARFGDARHPRDGSPVRVAPSGSAHGGGPS